MYIYSADGKRQVTQNKSSSKRAPESGKKMFEEEQLEEYDGPEMKNITDSNKSASTKYLYN